MNTPRLPLPRSALRAVLSLAAALGALLLGSAHAQLAPGEYLGENGTGRLVIQPAGGGAQKFNLNSYGANGHSCEVEGSIRGLVARVPTEDKQPPCTLKFNVKGESIAVDADGPTCQFFCGARATLGDTFLKPAPGCTTAEVKKTRAAFKQQFDKKDYAQAKALLQPVVDKCLKLMNDVDEGWVRNDMALTLLRLNDKPGCLKMLESFKDLAAMDQKALEENYPPFDAQIRAPVARATRTNMKLCGAK